VVLGDVLQDFDVVLKRLLLFVQLGKGLRDCPGVILNFGAKAGFGLMNQMPVMCAFDATFQTQRDEETHRDGEEMEKEVANTVHLSVRRVDVEHRRNLVCGVGR
jgi:hypothetical protein